MRNIGHYGTGDIEIVIKNKEDFEKAKPLIDRAYHEG
jgi:predicted transport protein